MLTLEASYSTLCPSELLAKVVPHYSIPAPDTCEFWHRGLNDTYKLSAGKESFMLRVYRQGWRSRSEIEFELEVLLYLQQKGAHVAVPVARKDGEFITSILAPEGERYVMITQYAQGDILRFDDAKDAVIFGQAAADIHCCSARFRPTSKRFQLDLNHLLNEPLAHIQPYLIHRPADWEFLNELATRISSLVNSVGTDNLDYGFCHGDFHGENAHASEGTVTHFDFDCCGFGWRIYDLATFKWVIRLLDKEEQLWSGFLESYQSKREISDLDLSLMEPFIAIRDVWLLGVHAENAPDFAKGRLNDRHMDFHINFLRQVSEAIDYSTT
ncbi:phosphotransferase [Leptolyngbya cf. ectocarpi LEGE 11479]|uniref:Phosphotransferase n=1 Tax=Leptolyngbya cf. ectocarpi LEGE 11479 TaxID=1828722 RepID=A0A928ZRN0_LEPEC|nr:phosphotransferase [Leptolyngbya ectocarpi]MBE9066793.1 phosphotransferase [Leptolyngbya cf. ectocarpi LEGE 11479]